MDWLIDFFKGFWDYLVEIFVWLLDGVVFIFTQLVYLFVDGFLIVVEGFFAVLDLSGLVFDTAAQWSGLPAQLIWLINEVDLPQGFSLITGAIALRMLINLIPAAFTRV